MAKLTHIEDVERRNAEEEDAREMAEAQEALQQTQQREAVEQQEARAGIEQTEQTLETLEEAAEGEPVLDVTSEAEKESFDRDADEEAEFHGLTSDDSMGVMQKVLIVLAVIIFVAAILYVVNSWVHFV